MNHAIANDRCTFELERVALGSMIRSTEAATNVSARLSYADFTEDGHRFVFAIVRGMLADGLPVDPLAVVRQAIASGDCGEERLALVTQLA